MVNLKVLLVGFNLNEDFIRIHYNDYMYIIKHFIKICNIIELYGKHHIKYWIYTAYPQRARGAPTMCPLRSKRPNSVPIMRC